MLSRREFLAKAMSVGVLLLTGCRKTAPTPSLEIPSPGHESFPIPSPHAAAPLVTPTPVIRLKALVIEHAPQRAEGLDYFLEANDVDFRLLKIYEGEALPLSRDCDVIISSGGPMAPEEFDAPQYGFLRAEMDYLLEGLEAGVPVLGICLGHQLLARALGGEVAKGKQEVGWHKVTLTLEGEMDALFRGLEREFYVFQYHTDEITRLPEGARNLALSPLCEVQAFRHQHLPAWGLQFHPEVRPDLAAKILRNAKRIPLGDMDVETAISLGYQVYGPSQEQIFKNLFALARS